LISLIERIVALSTRRPWTVIAVAALLTLVKAYVAVTRFVIDTKHRAADLGQLDLSPE
jgi:hypothetical protein